MELEIRRSFTLVEERLIEAGRPADPPLRKVAAVAVVRNPCLGGYVEDLGPMIAASVALGGRLAAQGVAALEPYTAESYGKGGLVGMAGEQEHANALLTTAFANPIREAIGGGDAWISSMTKMAAPGVAIDVPMNCKEHVYVRSHYDGMTVVLPDAPQPDEIAIILCLANRGRLNARVGGMTYEEASAPALAGRP